MVWCTGKALAVQSEQAEEAPFMECAQTVGSTLPGRPEQEFWGETTWFEILAPLLLMVGILILSEPQFHKMCGKLASIS